MGRNAIETLMGAVVLIVAIGFVVFAYQNSSMHVASNGYPLFAKFEHIDGLAVGSEVRIGGIKVGTVTQASLESDTYLAKIDINIQPNVQLPKDSTAQIVSDGLLGSKYVSIVPGSEEAMLKPEEEITFTQSSVNLETLIGKFMFSGDKAGAKDEHPATTTDAPPAELPHPQGPAAPISDDKPLVPKL